MDDYIHRRVAFLLTEARLNAKRDQAITFIMRVLSNHATVDKDASSSLVKKLNRRVSLRARQELDQVKTFNEWTSKTINEHPIPLKVSWQWLLSNSAELNIEDVWEHFINCPMTTILKTEDRDINEKGLRSSGGASRYSDVGIKIVELDTTPIERFKKRTQ